jgi:hypothetical protein
LVGVFINSHPVNTSHSALGAGSNGFKYAPDEAGTARPAPATGSPKEGTAVTPATSPAPVEPRLAPPNTPSTTNMPMVMSMLRPALPNATSGNCFGNLKIQWF